MSYFDDVMPAITALSPSEGPEIGGTRVYIRIARFPVKPYTLKPQTLYPKP